MNEQKKEYDQRPEVKEQRKEYLKQYRQKPEVKEKYNEYRQQADAKEKQKEYQKIYNQKPEVKERNNNRKSQIVVCECGCTLRCDNISNHKKTKIHLTKRKHQLDTIESIIIILSSYRT